VARQATGATGSPLARSAGFLHLSPLPFLKTACSVAMRRRWPVVDPAPRRRFCVLTKKGAPPPAGQGTAGGGASGRGAWCDPRHRSARGAGEWRAPGPHAPVEQLKAASHGATLRTRRPASPSRSAFESRTPSGSGFCPKLVNPYSLGGAKLPVKRVTLRGVMSHPHSRSTIVCRRLTRHHSSASSRGSPPLPVAPRRTARRPWLATSGGGHRRPEGWTRLVQRRRRYRAVRLPSWWVVGQFESRSPAISFSVQTWSATPAAIAGVLG